jgi:hypothetical protein
MIDFIWIWTKVINECWVRYEAYDSYAISHFIPPGCVRSVDIRVTMMWFRMCALRGRIVITGSSVVS